MRKGYWNTIRTQKTKYGAKKAVVDGIEFDSKKEAKRYIELKDMLDNGAIQDLQRQVKFVLIPAQREPDGVGVRGGKIKGKVIEREVAYYADFVYYIPECPTPIVEDVKGIRTTEYIIKRKLMLYIHNIRIKEI